MDGSTGMGPTHFDAPHQQERLVPARNSVEEDRVDQSSPPITNPPDYSRQQQLVQIAQLSYGEFSVKIFTEGTSTNINNSPRFFFEPIVVLDSTSITIQSQDLFKEDVVSFTIQMWSPDIRSKVLELLRLDNPEIKEKDVSVMPYEDVQLVSKPGSIHQSVQIMEDIISYHRQNERLEFFLLCDSPSTAQNLADNLCKCPAFLVRKWQLALECRGLLLNSSVTDGKASSINRPIFKLIVSTYPTVGQSNIYFLYQLFKDIYSFTLLFLAVGSSDKFPTSLSGADSSGAKAIGPDKRVDGDRPVSQFATIMQEPSPPSLLKQLDTVASSSRPVKEEKVNVAQLKLAPLIRQPSPSSKKSMCHLLFTSYFPYF